MKRNIYKENGIYGKQRNAKQRKPKKSNVKDTTNTNEINLKEKVCRVGELDGHWGYVTNQ